MKTYNLYIKLGKLKRMELCTKVSGHYITDCGSVIDVNENVCTIICSGEKIKCELLSLKVV